VNISTPSMIFVVGIIGIALICAAVFAFLRGRKMIVGVLIVTFVIALLWLGREFQPWMPQGRAVHISSSHYGQYDFQVWQRKNDSITEPFTTGLFARKQNEQWKVFLLDFEDTYHPSVTLQEDASGVAVLEDGEKLGTFDFKQEVLRRGPDGAVLDGITLTSEPPGEWSTKN
jgi:hypothetical protein